MWATMAIPSSNAQGLGTGSRFGFDVVDHPSPFRSDLGENI
jgi:hypothetical protein